MRECQVCGVKSFGPLDSRGRATLLETIGPKDKSDFDRYRECDNCGAPALIEIIEKPASDAEFPSEAPFSVPSLTALADPGMLMDRLIDRAAEPETRLERLVRAILCGNLEFLLKSGFFFELGLRITDSILAMKIIELAKCIESELLK